VENAIYHGIKNKEVPGTVRVSGRRDGTDLVIQVADDGVGMPADQLAELERRLHEPLDLSSIEAPGGPFQHGGVGVRNVQERIALYFGPDYGLSFESEPGRGCVATIRIPVVAGASTASRCASADGAAS
jgi:two-component system sensor histidine kinase YesM